MPAVLVHGWLPDAYRAAPLPVLALLSGVLSKVGAYGFLRVALPLYPEATVQFQELILVIGVASILYGSVMAFTQTNVRLIAGYSSIAQLGFITIGIFSLRPDGADGAVLQMVNHGLVVAPIFLIVALLAERAGTEDLTRLGGLAMRAPVLAALFLIVTLATLAMPGSANFIGEFYILIGVFQAKIVVRLRGRDRGRAGGLLRDPPLPAHDAQPKARGNVDSREIGAPRRGGARPARRLHRRPGPLSGPDPGPKRAAVKDKIAACRQPAPAAPSAPRAHAPGWTGYAPIAHRGSELHRPRTSTTRGSRR